MAQQLNENARLDTKELFTYDRTKSPLDYHRKLWKIHKLIDEEKERILANTIPELTVEKVFDGLEGMDNLTEETKKTIVDRANRHAEEAKSNALARLGNWIIIRFGMDHYPEPKMREKARELYEEMGDSLDFLTFQNKMAAFYHNEIAHRGKERPCHCGQHKKKDEEKRCSYCKKTNHWRPACFKMRKDLRKGKISKAEAKDDDFQDPDKPATRLLSLERGGRRLALFEAPVHMTSFELVGLPAGDEDIVIESRDFKLL